jgi:hypothetical protein
MGNKDYQKRAADWTMEENCKEKVVASSKGWSPSIIHVGHQIVGTNPTI